MMGKTKEMFIQIQEDFEREHATDRVYLGERQLELEQEEYLEIKDKEVQNDNQEKKDSATIEIKESAEGAQPIQEEEQENEEMFGEYKLPF